MVKSNYFLYWHTSCNWWFHLWWIEPWLCWKFSMTFDREPKLHLSAFVCQLLQNCEGTCDKIKSKQYWTQTEYIYKTHPSIVLRPCSEYDQSTLKEKVGEYSDWPQREKIAAYIMAEVTRTINDVVVYAFRLVMLYILIS